MKIIGMFFSNKIDMVEAFRKHSQNVQNMARQYSNTSVNPKEMKITIEDCKWLYYTFKDNSEINRIAGIQFDAIFSEVIDPKAKWYISTRFRPGLNG